MKTVTRFGELSRVFVGGRSELLNDIARLAILYEDLRLEMMEFQSLQQKFMVRREEDTDNRVQYFLRRSLETLMEFGRGLNRIRAMDEFKRATPFLATIDAKYIAEADKFIQQNGPLIKDLRNEFGGHIQPGAVAFAVKHLTNEVGKVTWNPDPNVWTVGIECHFASILLAGVISSRLQTGTDVLTELRKALDILTDGFVHVQGAMVAFVHAFLWDRFG